MSTSRLRKTDDGSHTLFSELANENYHSSFGAIQESKHIFIVAGLAAAKKSNNTIRILEVGTGTGLNVLLTYLWAKKNKVIIDYHGFEPFPILLSEAKSLNYPKLLDVDEEVFYSIHNNNEGVVSLSDNFTLLVNNSKIETAELQNDFFDVVFYDAFSPTAQPHMWTVKIFSMIFASLKSGGVFTTYSCKGNVKRALKQVGFRIEKLPGPPGKREFLRAWKD